MERGEVFRYCGQGADSSSEGYGIVTRKIWRYVESAGATNFWRLNILGGNTLSKWDTQTNYQGKPQDSLICEKFERWQQFALLTNVSNCSRRTRLISDDERHSEQN